MIGIREENCVGITSAGPDTRAEREHMGPQFAHVVTSRGPLGPKRMAPSPERWAPHQAGASHFQEEL